MIAVRRCTVRQSVFTASGLFDIDIDRHADLLHQLMIRVYHNFAVWKQGIKTFWNTFRTLMTIPDKFGTIKKPVISASCLRATEYPASLSIWSEVKP